MVKNNQWILAVVLVLIYSSSVANAYTEQQAQDMVNRNPTMTKLESDDFKIISITTEPYEKPNWFIRFFQSIFQQQTAFGIQDQYESGATITATYSREIDDTCPSGSVKYWAVLKHDSSSYERTALQILAQNGIAPSTVTAQLQIQLLQAPDGTYTLKDYVYCQVENRKMKDINGDLEDVTTFRVGDAQPTCTPNWQCGSWSSCIQNQKQRSCSDSNNCGTNDGKPATTEQCNGNTQVGCAYNNPSCNSGFTCVNNACVQDQVPTCNPACSTGYSCVNNACVPDVPIDDGEFDVEEFYNAHKTLVWVSGAGLILILLVWQNKRNQQNG